jgi:hypothetical protein
MDRPQDMTGINVMLEVLKRCLSKRYDGRWPG